jgi:exodeoxyribonuclease III
VLHNFITKYSPDIFCVNETKINKELYDKTPIYIKGYNGYWNFCKCSAGYSGVAIFSKFLPIAITEDIDEPAYSQEGRVITLEFEQFYVVAVYIPSAGGKELERLYYKTQQYEVAFQRYCQDLRKRGKPVIVCGDMNVSAEEIDIHLTANTHKQPGFTP